MARTDASAGPPTVRRSAPGLPADVLVGVRRRRRIVSQRFLWTLLALVVATMLLNLVLLGPASLRLIQLAPNLTFCAFIGVALWLNRRHRFHAAWASIIALLLAAATATLVLVGLEAGFLGLLLLFVPVVIAGLLLDRTALYLTAGIEVALVLAVLVAQGLGLVAPEAASTASTAAARTVALQFVVILAIVVFFLDRFALSLNDTLADAATREVALRDEIARRARSDEALRAEMEFSDAIIDSLPGVVYVLDPEGTVIRWNSALDRPQRRKVEATTQPPLDVMIRPAGDESLRSILERGFASGSTSFQGQLRRGEGEQVPYLFSGRRFARGSASFLVGVGIDRSEVDGARRHIERLNEELASSNRELRRAYDTTIEGWSRALDLRDHETEGHSRRVTSMTEKLALRLGVDEEALVHVRRGALLHDIGKMGVPDAVLLKPGALDAEEWAVMKRHTTYGYELLHPIPFLRPALDIPLCHHERWDGGGYPQGLQGESIPLPARAFAVVDVYDALTSDRPYRPAWSAERALTHIAEGAGSHFDPDIVPVFLDLVQSDPRVRA